eukprot:3608744-Alexandrium_andersonii.AAC.1
MAARGSALWKSRLAHSASQSSLFDGREGALFGNLGQPILPMGASPCSCGGERSLDISIGPFCPPIW